MCHICTGLECPFLSEVKESDRKKEKEGGKKDIAFLEIFCGYADKEIYK